jgi:hypothetical protein
MFVRDGDLFARFLQWFHSRTPVEFVAKTRIIYSESSGYGLVATQDLRANESVLTVASDCVLTVNHPRIVDCPIWTDFTEQVPLLSYLFLHIFLESQVSYYYYFAQEFFEHDAEIINLAVLLFFEKLKGDDSFFK